MVKQLLYIVLIVDSISYIKHVLEYSKIKLHRGSKSRKQVRVEKVGISKKVKLFSSTFFWVQTDWEMLKTGSLMGKI